MLRLWQNAFGGTGMRKLRLATGLVLFTYVTLHLLNHALGNISVQAMESGLTIQKWIWQGLIGTLALYTALGVHLSLGLWALYERRHFGWTKAEIVQLILGLSVPPLLTNHIFVTRMAFTLYGIQKGYAQELYSFWVASPELGVQQVAVLIVAWTHSCIGLQQWLRLKRFYPRAAPLLLTAATAIPMLALLGFYQAGRTVRAFASDPAWRAAHLMAWQVGTGVQNVHLASYRNWTIVTGAGLVILVLMARGVRAWRERRGKAIRIFYPNGRVALVPRGFSVLEASRAARIPHASVCGGRARCSTCRVRVLARANAGPPPPSLGERAILEQIAAAPEVRLACQLRPTSDIAVVPLLRPNAVTAALLHTPAPRRGEEQFIVVLVVDMRNSSRLVETRLPFDAMFIIDRFVATVGQAVVESGGRVTGFTGDGLIATFGIDGPPDQACRQAIRAVPRIGMSVRALNPRLEAEGAESVGFGIGIHGGTAVVGDIDLPGVRVFTALGEPANIAARLENLCKEFTCEAVISQSVCARSGYGLQNLQMREVAVRGRTGTLEVRTAVTAAELDVLADSPEEAASARPIGRV
jgi:adenylate cyclase